MIMMKRLKMRTTTTMIVMIKLRWALSPNFVIFPPTHPPHSRGEAWKCISSFWGLASSSSWWLGHRHSLEQEKVLSTKLTDDGPPSAKNQKLFRLTSVPQGVWWKWLGQETAQMGQPAPQVVSSKQENLMPDNFSNSSTELILFKCSDEPLE